MFLFSLLFGLAVWIAAIYGFFKLIQWGVRKLRGPQRVLTPEELEAQRIQAQRLRNAGLGVMAGGAWLIGEGFKYAFKQRPPSSGGNGGGPVIKIDP